MAVRFAAAAVVATARAVLNEEPKEFKKPPADLGYREEHDHVDRPTGVCIDTENVQRHGGRKSF